MQLDTFTRAYLDCAIWTSTGEDDAPLDRDLDASDFAPETLERMVNDCATFQADNAHLMLHMSVGSAGHDFWLTRNRHGAGFWARGYAEEIGKALTARAHAYGEVELYVVDGLVYMSGL